MVAACAAASTKALTHEKRKALPGQGSPAFSRRRSAAGRPSAPRMDRPSSKRRKPSASRHPSSVTCHLSPVPRHPSPVPSHLSPVTLPPPTKKAHLAVSFFVCIKRLLRNRAIHPHLRRCSRQCQSIRHGCQKSRASRANQRCNAMN